MLLFFQRNKCQTTTPIICSQDRVTSVLKMQQTQRNSLESTTQNPQTQYRKIHLQNWFHGNADRSAV